MATRETPPDLVKAKKLAELFDADHGLEEALEAVGLSERLFDRWMEHEKAFHDIVFPSMSKSAQRFADEVRAELEEEPKDAHD